MSYSVYLPNYSIGEDCYKEIPAVARRYGKKDLSSVTYIILRF